MDNGQAGIGPDEIEIANLLDDTSDDEAGHQEDEHNPDGPEQDNPDGEDGQSADDDAESDKEEGESEKEPEQASGQKHKVTVKGIDGKDEEREVTLEQLKSGYMMREDYSRKTMELADRERDGVQAVTSKVTEFRDHYMREAQTLRSVLAHAAGSRSPEEMAQLAQVDPSAWAQERQRQDTLRSFIGRIEQSMGHEQEQARQLAQQQHQDAQRRMADVLQGEGFDIPKLQGVFKAAHETYGFTAEELKNINNPALIRMMRDATEFQALKAKTSEVKKKLKDAPKLPPPRQSTPRAELVDKARTQRLRTGRGTLQDAVHLADLI